MKTNSTNEKNNAQPVTDQYLIELKEKYPACWEHVNCVNIIITAQQEKASTKGIKYTLLAEITDPIKASESALSITQF